MYYRKRLFIPPSRLAKTVKGLRFWTSLNIGGDFAWFRLHPSRWELYRRLKPDFRRWAFYAVWDDEMALSDFMVNSPTSQSWKEECRQGWHLRLRPLRATGPWMGTKALQTSDAPLKSEGPVAVLVRLNLTLRGTIAMWGSAAPALLPHLPGPEDLLAAIPLMDRPYMQPVSFSVWPSLSRAMDFVYKQKAHMAAVVRVQNSQPNLIESHSAAQFLVSGSEGSWNDRNPLPTALTT